MAAPTRLPPALLNLDGRFVILGDVSALWQQFAQLVAGVRDYAVSLLDARGSVATWNTGAERIEGFGAEEAVGQLHDVGPGLEPDALEKLLAELASGTAWC